MRRYSDRGSFTRISSVAFVFPLFLFFLVCMRVYCVRVCMSVTLRFSQIVTDLKIKAVVK